MGAQLSRPDTIALEARGIACSKQNMPRLATILTIYKRALTCMLGTTTALASTSCYSEGEKPLGVRGLLQRKDRVEVEPRVPDDWIGHELGVSPGTWRYAGKMTTFDGSGEISQPTQQPGDSDEVPPKLDAMMVGNSETGDMFEVEMSPEDLRTIAKALESIGYAAPTHRGEATSEEPEEKEKGWSGGVDNRTSRGLAYLNYPEDHWPYRTLGQLKPNNYGDSGTGHCSGAFVGSAGNSNTRYVLTAAHCLWAAETGEYYDPDFFPRQDSCQFQGGGNVPSCDPTPYGEWDTVDWVTWAYFVNECVGDHNLTDSCLVADIAVLKVNRVSGSFPGAIGFTYKTPDYLDARTKYMRGYPNCGGPGDPVFQCLNRTLYGDGALSINNGSYLIGDYPRLYKHTSDNSAGTSGANFYYENGGSTYAFGVHVGEGGCVGDTCGTYSGTARPIDEAMYDVMLSFMGL